MENQPENNYQPKKYVELSTPDWVKNATLYELNVRQFSDEGNFQAVEKQLPRLKKMGIDIIWLMPINPIGELHRKGSLGSYYSVKDYLGINAEFGTEDDFRSLVEAIHNQGMYVILDWVANHTSWDNHLVDKHPEWYMKSRKGTFQSTRWRDYDDIIELNYKEPELRKYMTDAMKYWVEEYNIDGFRCDIASFVPIDFWENARAELDKIKPIFMLAEAEDKELHRKAFDSTYNWTLWNILHQIVQNDLSVKTLTEAYIAEHVSIFPKAGIRMNFIDNHDKNSWEGNQYDNFGEALEATTVFTFLMDGIPLVYSGQEAGLDRSLKFFDKDLIFCVGTTDKQRLRLSGKVGIYFFDQLTRKVNSFTLNDYRKTNTFVQICHFLTPIYLVFCFQLFPVFSSNFYLKKALIYSGDKIFQ